jgi:hypothetical protein
MARDRPLAEGQNCGDAPAFKRHQRVAHCVDTAMKAMKMPSSQAALNSIPVKPCVAQLGPADYAVLPTGNRGDHLVESGALFPHMGNKSPTPVPRPPPQSRRIFIAGFRPSPLTAGVRRARAGSSAPRILSARWLPPLNTASPCASSSMLARSPWAS